MIGNVQLFAEVKTISPLGWKAEASWEELFDLAAEYGDVVSIHTDPLWHGSFKLLYQARKRTSKPILAKGIHASDEDLKHAFGVGADYALVVGRIPDIGVSPSRLFIEPLTLKELLNVPSEFPAVWNARSLLNLFCEVSGFAPQEGPRPLFQEARATRPNGFLVQASHLRTVYDIAKGADAVLVGTHLIGFIGSLP